MTLNEFAQEVYRITNKTHGTKRGLTSRVIDSARKVLKEHEIRELEISNDNTVPIIDLRHENNNGLSFTLIFQETSFSTFGWSGGTQLYKLVRIEPPYSPYETIEEFISEQK